jgi:hypothetical protein
VDFAHVINTVSRFFEDHDLPFAVIGGISMAAYGMVHTTLDVDLPTTPEDVEALRSRRPRARLGDLKNLNQLCPPDWMHEREGLRRPFGDWPPFEL